VRSVVACAALSLALGLLGTGAASPEKPQSPAEQKIESARRAIQARPGSEEPHNALAFALARRARETGDPTYYDKAADALKESLRIAPDNFEACKIEAWIALGKHEFARALELTRALNKRMPDDVLTYALLTDACVEMGRYDEAEKAAQWSLDMRPGAISGLTRAAYLRELFGQIDGAIELMQSAYAKTAPDEVEDRAWILNQIAHLQLLNGYPDIAEGILATVLELFPNYHYALGNLVKVRTAQKRYDDAVEAARSFLKAAPHPENLFVLGQALDRAGKKKEARKVFAEFEEKALAESEQADNANRELVFYYTDYADDPAAALRIAELEIGRRQDIFTRHAYAWALYANGKFADARTEMDKALEVGIRDPAFFYHAGMICMKSGDHQAAERYLQRSIKQTEQSEVSDLARRALAENSQL
jgi:tetratricopeptide (TPR) repeat protein